MRLHLRRDSTPLICFVVQSALNLTELELALYAIYAPAHARALAVLYVSGMSSQELADRIGLGYTTCLQVLGRMRRNGHVGKRWTGKGVCRWYITKAGRKWLRNEIESAQSMLFPGVPEK